MGGAPARPARWDETKGGRTCSHGCSGALERIERIHEAAGRLISEFGVEAAAEARRREREVNSIEAARDWKGVASVIARRTPKQAALDAATGPSPMEVPPVAEPMWNDFGSTEGVPIHICATPDQGQSNLTERQIEAEDTSAAIVAAANTEWPPLTVGLRILDREGREVFAREKVRRRYRQTPEGAFAPRAKLHPFYAWDCHGLLNRLISLARPTGIEPLFSP